MPEQAPHPTAETTIGPPPDVSFLHSVEYTPDDPGLQAWHVFQQLTGSRDIESFRQRYRGHWPSRADFGQYLASEFGADRRQAVLPMWLRRYIQIDGDQVTADFVNAGHYIVRDLPENAGCVVFDADP